MKKTLETSKTKVRILKLTFVQKIDRKSKNKKNVSLIVSNGIV